MGERKRGRGFPGRRRRPRSPRLRHRRPWSARSRAPFPLAVAGAPRVPPGGLGAAVGAGASLRPYCVRDSALNLEARGGTSAAPSSSLAWGPVLGRVDGSVSFPRRGGAGGSWCVRGPRCSRKWPREGGSQSWGVCARTCPPNTRPRRRAARPGGALASWVH